MSKQITDPETVSNLVGYWQLAHGSGSIARDLSRSANHGSLVNTQWSESVPSPFARQQVLSFDGSGYIQFQNAAGLPSGNSPYTLEAWILPGARGARGIIGWGTWGTANTVNALRRDGQVVNGFEVDRLINYWWACDIVSGAVDLSTVMGRWHHVAVTYDGQTRTMYVDAEPVMTKEDGAQTGTERCGVNNAALQNLAIGATNNLNERWVGSIAEVRVWKVARTLAEIRANMNVDLDVGAAGGNLVGYWPLTSAQSPAQDEQGARSVAHWPRAR